MPWQDTSEWYPSEKDRSVPKEWTFKTPGTNVCLHHKHYDKENWYLSIKIGGVLIIQDLNVGANLHTAKIMARGELAKLLEKVSCAYTELLKEEKS